MLVLRCFALVRNGDTLCRVKSRENDDLSQETLAHLKSVGANLSLIRRSLGLTQADLAKLANMGTSTIVSIEKGSPEVSLRHWFRAMEVLGLTTGVHGFGSMGPNAGIIQGMASYVPKRGGGKGRGRGSGRNAKICEKM